MRQRVLTEELVQWLSHLDSFWKTFGYKMPSSGKNTFFLSPITLQSVRWHSAFVLTVTVNGLQEIHPVIYLLFKLSHN